MKNVNMAVEGDILKIKMESKPHRRYERCIESPVIK